MARVVYGTCCCTVVCCAAPYPPDPGAQMPATLYATLTAPTCPNYDGETVALVHQGVGVWQGTLFAGNCSIFIGVSCNGGVLQNSDFVVGSGGSTCASLGSEYFCTTTYLIYTLTDCYLTADGTEEGELCCDGDIIMTVTE